MSDSKWDCKYHVVFIRSTDGTPFYGHIRQHLVAIFHELARQAECQILEGHVMSDHLHMIGK
jgi:putative transposase